MKSFRQFISFFISLFFYNFYFFLKKIFFALLWKVRNFLSKSPDYHKKFMFELKSGNLLNLAWFENRQIFICLIKLTLLSEIIGNITCQYPPWKSATTWSLFSSSPQMSSFWSGFSEIFSIFIEFIWYYNVPCMK